MKMIVLLSAIVLGLTSCDNTSGKPGDANDSVSTDSLQNPSYNPVVEGDSAAKQMNLDSAKLKDTGIRQ